MAQLELSSDPKAEYERKLVSAERAAERIRSGDQVWIPSSHITEAVLAAMLGRMDELENVKIRSTILPDFGWFTEDARKHFDIQVQYAIVPESRRALADKIIDFHPFHMIQQHKAIDAGRDEVQPIDVLLIKVSPPTKEGWLCVGNSVWDSVSNCPRAGLVIAEVSEGVVRTRGDSWVHVSQLDAIVENHGPRLDLPPPEGPEPADRAIAENLRPLIRDRATLQIGLGSHTAWLAEHGAFDGGEDLSYFGELTVRGVVDLVRQGRINGKYASLHPNKCVSTHVGNSIEDLDYIEDNPAFELRSYDYTNDPRVICQNENMTAINGALMVDLTGQIGVYGIGPTVYTGLGGQLAFVMGAALCPTGRSITVLPSTARSGELSAIVPHFETGQIVSIPRELADTIVTDHGVARLWGKSVRERARELIGIAHPDHRPELERAAHRLFG